VNAAQVRECSVVIELTNKSSSAYVLDYIGEETVEVGSTEDPNHGHGHGHGH